MGRPVPGPLLVGGFCGLVNATALALVFAGLSKDQVPGPYDGGDAARALLLGGLATLVTVAVLAVAAYARRRVGGRWSAGNVLLPLVLFPLVLTAVAVAGGERNRLETGALWAAAVLVLHLLVALAAIGPGRRRVYPVLGLMLTLAVAYGVTAAAQNRWRAQKLAAVGLPLYVPEVPGYRLTGTHAGHAVVTLHLRADPVQAASGPSIDVWIVRRGDGEFARCGPGSTARWLMAAQPGAPRRLAFCLPEGSVMTLAPGYATAPIDEVLPAVVVRRVKASDLAGYPEGAEWEAD